MYRRMKTNQNSELLKSYAINEIIRKYPQTRVRERVREEVEIEVPLKISKSKGALWILVVLPNSYPQNAPLIQVINAQVEHKYIGHNFRIIHPVLENWTKDSSLWAAIDKINVEFDNSPPQLIKGSKASKATNKPAKAKTQGLKLRLPKMSDLEEKLKNLSTEEATEITDDDEKFKEFIQEFYDDFIKILIKMKSKSEENLKLKEQLEEVEK